VLTLFWMQQLYRHLFVNLWMGSERQIKEAQLEGNKSNNPGVEGSSSGSLNTKLGINQGIKVQR